MDSLTSVSPTVVLPPSNSLRFGRKYLTFSSRSRFPSSSLSLFDGVGCYFRSSEPRSWKSISRVFCSNLGSGDVGDEERKEEVDKALNLDGTIPGSSDEFVRQVSSRAYDMRRHLHQSFDTSSYDVLEANPWRDDSKPVYVLTHNENRLCTMKTRRNRSEVERELGILFSKGWKRKSDIAKQTKQSRTGTKFQMFVEDIREGVLVFEDQSEAVRYCDLLQGGGQGCEGVAEIEASSVFDLCRKMRALAVLFRRGRAHPLPQSLELNLKARKRSLEDEEHAV